MAACMFASLALGLTWPPPESRYMLGNESVIYSSCSAQFNTPCAISKTHELVYRVGSLLEQAADVAGLSNLLTDINAGAHNDDHNFWPNVLNENGTYLASGRLRGTDLTGAALAGLTVEQAAKAETLLLQDGLWDRIRTAAAEDGYFTFWGWDNDHRLDAYTRLALPFHSSQRVGWVQRVATAVGALYVFTAFSDMPLNEQSVCDVRVDKLCSSAYARKVVGVVTTAAMLARTAEELQDVWARVTQQAFNEQQSAHEPAGFYPFAGNTDLVVAHGANPGFVGLSLQMLVAGAGSILAGVVDGEELTTSFTTAAQAGGGYVGYNWRNTPAEAPYLKVAFITGVRRFGVDYYIGALQRLELHFAAWLGAPLL